MMGAESTRNMCSNFAVKNKDDCLKLHHVGCLINKYAAFVGGKIFLVIRERNDEYCVSDKNTVFVQLQCQF
jgi:hypothetical protein